jgi:hypothetical protein
MDEQVAEAMEECAKCLKNQKRRIMYMNSEAREKKYRPTREYTHEEKRVPLWAADEIPTGMKPQRKGCE